jgi:hypothetical protein
MPKFDKFTLPQTKTEQPAVRDKGGADEKAVVRWQQKSLLRKSQVEIEKIFDVD